ncbi:MAG: translocation/assembly module TamB domain-containing protein [Holophagaceae bacterium]
MWTLASGAALAAVGAWSLGRPSVQQALLRYADGRLREETGLGLAADGFEFAPFRGRLVVRGLAIGGDLLRASRVEVRADLLSLAGSEPRVRRLDIEGLALRVDRERLSRVRLKPRPERPSSVKLRLDEVHVRGGSADVREPAWGLAEAALAFDLDGRGEGPNRLRFDLSSKALAVQAKGDRKRQEGSLRLSGRAGEDRLELEDGMARLGPSQVRARGSYRVASGQLEASAQASLDLAALPLVQAAVDGQVEVHGTLGGTATEPRWALGLEGRRLSHLALPLRPGSLALKASGQPGVANVHAFRWTSEDGQLEAEGSWRRQGRARATFKATGLELGALAERLKVPDLRGLRGEAEGALDLPADLRSPARLDSWKLQAKARLTRGGAPAGSLDFALEGGRLDLSQLRLELPALSLEARAGGSLGRRGLQSLQASGSVATEAGKVASVLRAWKVADLDMDGAVRSSAVLSWTPAQGLRLDGGGAVTGPRWHGATAEQVRATVQIRGNELYVFDIQADKGAGRGVGDLWLTWANLPPGSTQMDMCFRAFRLPAREGLKAADLGDLPIDGTVSGWARLGGPFDRLLLTGDVLAEEGRVYGLDLPAATANLELDLTADTLRVPEFRVAESLDQLFIGEGLPGGLLALRGDLAMDLQAGTWRGTLRGSVDSGRLGVPGPRLLGRVEGTLHGPWTSPFGPVALPSGTLDLSGLRIFLGQQSLEGLRASVRLDRGELTARLEQEGAQTPLLQAWGWDTGGRAAGALRFDLSPASAGTSRLARRLTDDVLEDLALDLSAIGTWDPAGLRWEARSDRLEARFSAFSLHQLGPGRLVGRDGAAELDLELEARDQAVNAGSAGRVVLRGALPLSPQGPLRLRATGTSEVSEVKEVMDRLLDLDPYSLLADMRPAGLARMDLTLEGSYAAPELRGTLALDNGRLQVKSYPQSIEDLAFMLRFEGRDILLPKEAPLRGRLAQGELKAWGKATWTPGDENVPGGLSAYNVDARLEDFQLRDLPEGFELQGDLEATLRGDDENGGVLAGVLRADRMLYRADINLADLLLSNTLGSTPDLSALDPDDLLSRIELDLDLRLTQPWQFDTNLLKLQGRAEGPFRVRGTLAKPGLKGKMSLVPGGRLTNLLPAGDIVIEQGTLDFVDPNTLDPVLNIQGRVDVPPYLVNLSLTGNLNQLSVSPTSTPSLRQEEIVSVLIDPATAQTVGSGAGTTSQSSLNSGLASASYGLISTLAFARFQENLRKTLGLDRVSFAVRTGSAGTLESNLVLGKTFTILDRRIPLLYGYRQAGESVTHSGQAEWRIGNLVMQMGLSRTGVDPVNPTGEIRYTWSPRW